MLAGGKRKYYGNFIKRRTGFGTWTNAHNAAATPIVTSKNRVCLYDQTLLNKQACQRYQLTQATENPFPV